MEKPNGKKIVRKAIELLGLKVLDIYIIRKFLGTFFFSILIILSIAVVFDFSEKIDDFIENNASFNDVIFDYYMNFIPYFAVLFSSLFTFISVIYFTSKMAYDSEIIAILSSGINLTRLLRPYMLSAFVIAAFSFMLSNLVLPKATRIKLDFEEKYIHSRPVSFDRKNIHRQIEPGKYIYMESYSNVSQTGYNFSMEKFDNGKLVSKLMADQIFWDSTKNKWTIRRYYIRDIDGLKETITADNLIDTTINMYPEDFMKRVNVVEAMSLGELNEFISVAKMQGETNVTSYLIEKYRRTANPFSTFILTIIGVAVSSRKVRGGIGAQLGAGLVIAFGYILFMQFSSQFSISGSLPPLVAVWIPNFIFMIVAVIIYRMAPK
ncbi:MAG: LptF/LptG family permease [Bacteroidales bacterium]|nr:LptF/LptG family permease [Bacteroidales bacterium]MCF8389297.1 LptF/LptG family permease [Bacteroidales bacterium]